MSVKKIYEKKELRKGMEEPNAFDDFLGIEIKNDATDHFWFECCEDEMIVASVELRTKQNGSYICVFFILFCPICKKYKSRKMYVNTRNWICEKGDTTEHVMNLRYKGEVKIK